MMYYYGILLNIYFVVNGCAASAIYPSLLACLFVRIIITYDHKVR